MDVGNVDGIRAQGSLDSDVHTVSPYRLCWVEVLPTKLLALVLVCWAGDLLFLLGGVDQADELASHALCVLRCMRSRPQWPDIDGLVV